MRMVVINFELADVNEEQYRGMCDQLAPLFAEVPGLLSKVWLADSESGTYGGIYTFADREAFMAFAGSELAQGVATNPHLKNFTMKDFGVLEAPTAVTRGLAAAAAA